MQLALHNVKEHSSILRHILYVINCLRLNIILQLINFRRRVSRRSEELRDSALHKANWSINY
jgi:hypothetical protein